jgi:hypothetical protein
VKVIPFGRTTRGVSDAETKGKLGYTAGEAGRGTDLEVALREGMAAMPAGLVPRIVLITDGKENKGSVTRATWQAQQLGVPVDVFPMAGRQKPALRLESVSFPTQAFAGDRFPIDIAIEAPRKAGASIELSAEGKALGTNPVDLQPGMNRVRVHVTLNTPGAIDLAGVVKSAELGEVRFAQSVALRLPKALYVTQDPAGSGKDFMEVLAAMLILIPILVPASIQYGIDPLHFGLMFVFNLILGTIHPPIGVVLFVTSKIAGISFEAMSRAVLPWLIPLLLTLVAITVWPPLTTALPHWVMGR